MGSDTAAEGVLLFDKPRGMTSHDVVNAVRRRFGFLKVGHAGTLDPMATGLLVMLIGRATKLSHEFLNDDKMYEAVIRLGVATDTGDSEGKKIKEAPCGASERDVIEALKKFEGEVSQVPPMFSAKRHKGKKLYQYARKGVNIARAPRKVFIKELKILSMTLPEVSLKIACSKGTYIRQLAVDVGEALGCGGHLKSLRRTGSGRFSVHGALCFEEFRDMSRESFISRFVR